jgi:hypothetical protein
MASDFSVAWQCLSKRTIGFLLRIKLHAQKQKFIIIIIIIIFFSFLESKNLLFYFEKRSGLHTTTLAL